MRAMLLTVTCTTRHFRQGSLALEDSLKTQTWWHRSFSTLLGMTATDASLTFRYFHPNRAHFTSMEFCTFVNRLSKALVGNSYDSPVARRSRPSSLSPSAPECASSTGLGLQPLYKHAKYAVSAVSHTGTSRRIQLSCSQV